MSAEPHFKRGALVGYVVQSRNGYEKRGPFKVMGEIDGHVMFRFKGAAPSCMWWKDLRDWAEL